MAMRQNFRVQFLNFRSTDCAMCCPVLSWRKAGPFLLTNTIESICWAYFSDVMVSPGFRKLWWIRPAADHPTVTMIFFWCKFNFGKCFGASSQSNHSAGCYWSYYKTYFSWYVTIWSRNGSLVLRRREDDISKWWFFFLLICSQLKEDIKCILSLRSITTSVMEICKKCASPGQGITNIQ